MEHGPSGRAGTIGWGIVGAVVGALVLYVLIAFLGALAVGVFLYYATRPANRWLYARIGRSRVSATVTLLLVGLPILFVVGYATVVGLRELDQFLAATNLEQLRSALEPYLGSVATLDREGLIEILRGNVSRVGMVVGVTTGWLLRLFVVLTVGYYLLKDDEKISGWFRRSFADRPGAIEYAEAVDGDLQTIYAGNLLIIGFTTGIAIVVFSALNLVAPEGAGVTYPLLLGLLIGIGTLVPAVGMKLVYFPYTAYLLWQTQTGDGSPIWFPIVFFAVTLTVVDLLPDTIVRSFLASGDLNTGLVLLAYVLGAAVFGWYGIFFAPIVLVAFVHFAQDVFPRLV